MPRTYATRRSGALAAVVVLCALAAVACGKSAPYRDVVTTGEDVRIEINDPDAVDTWSVRTGSEADVLVLRLSGNQVDVGALRIRVLLPGGVVVAQIKPPRGDQFSIALSGRPATWTVEFGLSERESAPVRYRMVVGQPSGSGTVTGSTCADVLRPKGINAWVTAVSGPPAADGLVFPGLGTIAFSATPARTLSAAAPAEGALPVLHMRGGTTLRGEFGGLGCSPGQVQLNLWDTGKGKPPTMTVSDASGRPLCGGSGQQPCLSNPAPGRWVSWALSSSAAISRLSLECDELYLSSIVIQ